ncbi:hypothetical protein F383_32880 [Gossypium arboreum]|uniref:Uncharacterized protein n=1 Tax=Gossypium arboreum TaxID=29729 RepID=A0A0B0N5J2_GOSAR|nr:hypothetical protein F383_32880 [Gossypium arboreum]
MRSGKVESHRVADSVYPNAYEISKLPKVQGLLKIFTTLSNLILPYDMA